MKRHILPPTGRKVAPPVTVDQYIHNLVDPWRRSCYTEDLTALRCAAIALCRSTAQDPFLPGRLRYRQAVALLTA